MYVSSSAHPLFIMYMWQSRVEIEDFIPSHISFVSLRSKRCIAELALRAGLIRAS